MDLAEGGGGGLGEVAVDVYADLTRLESDFNKARIASKRAGDDIEKNVGASSKRTAREMRQLEQAGERLVSSYSPLHAAALRYERDLATINALLKENMLTQQEAAFFTGKATAAWNEASKSQSSLAAFASKARGQIALLGVALAAAAVTGTIAVVKSSIENAKAIKDTAAEVGVSIEAWQEWQYIAQQAGVEAGQLEQAFENLGRSTGRAAAGSKREAEAFELLGINLKDAEGKAKSLEALMPEIADGLLRIEDANQRAAVAAVFFGESANEILPALAGGSEGINNLADAARDLGIVLSEEEIRKLEQAGQKFDELKMILSAKISHVVAENADSIIEFTDNLIDFSLGCIEAVNALVKLANSPFGQIATGFLSILNPITMTINVLRTFGRVFGRGGGGGAGERGSAAGNLVGGLLNQPDVGPPIDASAFLARNGRERKGGGSGRGAAEKAERERIRALRDQAAFENEIAQMAAEVLRAGKSRAANADARAMIDAKLLDIERDRFERTLALEGPEGTKKYDAAEVERLRSAFAAADAAKRQEIELDRQDQNLKDQTKVSSSRLDNERELLSLSRNLAKSSRERRETDLALADLEYQLERLKAEEVLAASDSTDAEKEIARQRLLFLEDLRDVQRDIIERESRGPVADFFDTLQMSADELDDALERIRAADLEGQRQRAVEFADSIGAAFGDAAASIARLEDPLEAVISLLSDLAATFTEEVIARPAEEWARRNIGGPLAERVIGAPAGPEGLWMKTLETSGLNAAIKLDQLALAATRAAQGFSVQVLPGVEGLGSASADAAANIAEAAKGADAFANTASNAAQMLLSLAGGTGGGSAGGLLSLGLSILGSAIGGGVSAGTIARLTPDAIANAAANPAIFHLGGEIGPGGRAIHRLSQRARGSLKPGEVDIRAKVGEFMMPEGPTRQFRPLLEQMRLGKLPSLPAFSTFGRYGAIDRSMHVSFGAMTFPGVTDARTARTTRKQFSAAIQAEMAKAARQGIRQHD